MTSELVPAPTPNAQRVTACEWYTSPASSLISLAKPCRCFSASPLLVPPGMRLSVRTTMCTWPPRYPAASVRSRVRTNARPRSTFVSETSFRFCSGNSSALSAAAADPAAWPPRKSNSRVGSVSNVTAATRMRSLATCAPNVSTMHAAKPVSLA